MHLKIYFWFLFLLFLNATPLVLADNQEVAAIQEIESEEPSPEPIFNPRPDGMELILKRRQEVKAYNKLYLEGFKLCLHKLFLEKCTNEKNEHFLLLFAVAFLQTDKVAQLGKEIFKKDEYLWLRHSQLATTLTHYNETNRQEATKRYNTPIDRLTFNPKVLLYEISERERIASILKTFHPAYTPTTFGSGR